MRRRAFFALLLLAGACRNEPAAPAASARPAPPPPIEAERTNLLNVGFGAAVISRTAELTLDHSAVRAIDGDPASRWSSPPGDPQQTMTFSLAAPVRVEKLGLLAPSAPPVTIRTVTLETSPDGTTFTPIQGVQLKPTDEIQWFDAAIPSARYVRVTVGEGGSSLATLQSVHVRGEWLQPPSVAPIADCWAVNETTGNFAERGGRVAAWLDTAPEKTQLDGGRFGAVYRFAWARGPQWGLGLITLSPDGKRLTGMKWHELGGGHAFSTSWFGERRSCAPAGMQPDIVVDTFLRRAGWYPLFSLHFDEKDAVVEQASGEAFGIIENIVRGLPSQRIRLAAREYHESTPEANRRRAETRLRTLRDALTKRGLDLSRVDFAPLGADEPRIAIPTEAMRVMHGTVEIQVAPDGRSAF